MKRLTMCDINAYLDGDLTEEQRRDIEAAIAVDPAAGAVLLQDRCLVEALHRLYDGILEEPIPPRLRELLERYRCS